MLSYFGSAFHVFGMVFTSKPMKASSCVISLSVVGGFYMRQAHDKSVRIYDAGTDARQVHSQFFIDFLLKLGNELRQQRAPGEHEKFKNIPPIDMLHRAISMHGNLAKLAYLQDGKVFGTTWLGASTSIKAQASANSEFARVPFVVLRPSRTGKSIVAETTDGEITFTPKIKSQFRRHDSEYLLINFLEYLGDKGEVPISGGELLVVSELIPCDYCLNVLITFAKTHHDVTCTVAYMFETKGRSPRVLVNRGLPDNLALFKMSIVGLGAEATQITRDTPEYDISERVLEQGEAIDSSSHVSMRAVPIASLSLNARQARRST